MSDDDPKPIISAQQRLRWRECNTSDNILGVGYVLEERLDVMGYMYPGGEIAASGPGYIWAPVEVVDDGGIPTGYVLVVDADRRVARPADPKILDDIRDSQPPDGYDPYGNAPFHDPLENTEPEAHGEPVMLTEREAIRLAVAVATEYAYDHEHKGPEATELEQRLDRMARRRLGEHGREKQARKALGIEDEPLCQRPGCYHPRSAHIRNDAPRGAQLTCWRSGCACTDFLESS